jgi:hypothetical protein
MTVYQAGHFGSCSEAPLTLSHSPRGEGTSSQRAQPDSLSPWGEGWGEGVFVIQPGDMA